jgi:LEA14-like dessication related protein
MRKTLFLFGLGSLAFGLWRYYKRQLELISKISYKVVGVNLISVAPLTLDITTELTNNSEVAFTIRGYDIDVYVNGERVAKVNESGLDQKLKGFGDKSRISFTTTFAGLKSYGDGGIKGLLSGVLDNLGDTTISFKGKVSVKRGLFEFSDYPVDLEWKLAEFL